MPAPVDDRYAFSDEELALLEIWAMTDSEGLLHLEDIDELPLAECDRLDALLDALDEAGYAEVDPYEGYWWFTESGIERARALEQRALAPLTLPAVLRAASTASRAVQAAPPVPARVTEGPGGPLAPAHGRSAT